MEAVVRFTAVLCYRSIYLKGACKGTLRVLVIIFLICDLQMTFKVLAEVKSVIECTLLIFFLDLLYLCV